MPDNTLQQQFRQSIVQLAGLSLEHLEEELGRRLQVTSEEWQSGSALSAAGPMPPRIGLAGAGEAGEYLRRLGSKFLERLHAQLHSLLCNPNDPDHGKVVGVLNEGVSGLGYGIAGVLAVSFGLLPGIAAVVGTLIAQRVVKAGHEAVCESMKPTN